MADDEGPDEEREDMLSILRELRPYYFWILVVQIAIWSGVVFLSERPNCAEVGLSGCTVTMGLKMSGLVPLMLLTSVILVDVGRYLMVLLPNLRGKIRAEGKVEGEVQMHNRWSAWNSRRIEAERRGEPFDEPPPAPYDSDETYDNQ